MPTENKEAEKTTKTVVVREKQNGFTRPIAGTKTGLIWDIADSISAENKRPATRKEVFAEYEKQLGAGWSAGTAGTQYSRWCGFHGVSEVLKQQRVQEREKLAAEKAEEKAKIAKQKAEEKAAKAQEKADEKAKKDKIKADLIADKEAKAKAKADAKATGGTAAK